MTCSKLIGLLVLLAATASAQAPGGASFRDKGKNPPARWRGVTQKTASRTNCSVPTGFTFPVRLENAVYSYNVETPAIAVVEKDIVYSDEVKFSAMALSLDGSAGLKGTVETHKDAAVANTVLRSIVSGTSAALDAMGVSPMASQATQGLTQEAVKELDTERQQVTASITVEAETGLRVYIPQRLEY